MSDLRELKRPRIPLPRPLKGPRTEAAGTGERAATHFVQYRVSFVCTGNICRSPMAEMILRELASRVPLASGGRLSERLITTSAGTVSWHVGEPMDPRARAALEEHGYRDHGHVARQLETAEMDDLDLIVCLDRHHQQSLRSLASDGETCTRLVLLRSFDHASGGDADVPDPYYGGAPEFETCAQIVERSCRSLAAELARAAPRWG